MENHKPLSVLQVVGTMNRGGAEVMLMDIYRNIAPNIHFNFLVNYKIKQGVKQGDFDDEIIANGGVIKHIGTQWDLGPLKYMQEFQKICRELGIPDVIHIHLNAKSGVIALAAKRAGIKRIIIHSHADLHFRGSFLHNLISKSELFVQKFLISRYGTDFWGASYEANRSLFSSKNLKVSKVINNAIDADEYLEVDEREVNALRNYLSIDSDTVLIGNIGRIVRHKNLLFILQILDLLNKKNVDFVFIFAGRSDDESYFQEITSSITRLKLNDNVRYLGLRADIPVVMSAIDVFIAPALKEGFGLVAIEAQAAGTPCLLYKGFPRSVDLDLGLVSFFSEFSPRIWVEKVLEVKDKKKTEKALILKAIQNKGFDVKMNTRKIEKLYARNN